MSGTFRKAMLRVGTYHSPDGVVEVTPERLKHWSNETKRLQDAGYAIPMHWDHASDKELLEPIAKSELNRKETRSAKNTVGKLESFQVSEDGLSAEITVHTLTPSAAEKMSSNAVYVSPVIFQQWQDGAKNTYSDVITSVDLVDHPVDYSQGPFFEAEPAPVCCAIRMGLNTKIYRLSEGNMANEEDTTTEDSADGSVADSSGSALKDVLGALAALQIVLPDDTTPDNFLDRLHTALLTAAAQNGEAKEDEPVEKASEATTSDPMIATMSLQARQAVAYAERQHRETVQVRLKKLLEDGKCTPAEFDQKKGGLQAIKLSLNSAGDPEPSDLEKFIDSRESVPKGTFWDAESKLKKMSVQQSDPPTSWNDKSQMSKAEEDEAVNTLLRK